MNVRPFLRYLICVIVIVVVLTWPSNYLMLGAILAALASGGVDGCDEHGMDRKSLAR